MQRTLMNPNQNMINHRNINITIETRDTFRALVNAIIPRSPGLAYEYGIVQYYGALDLHIDEYIILTLNSYEVPLANATAEMLDMAAIQLIAAESGYENLNYYLFNGPVNFAVLDPYHQLGVIDLLRRLQIDLNQLPVPFQNNPPLIISTVNSLVSSTMMGYYSEWAGYGTTRLYEPNQRKLEYFPISWKQVGYPGPSLGYHALRPYQFT